MRKLTKILLSLMLMFGLTTSSFAASGGAKVKHDGKVKVVQKVNHKGHKAQPPKSKKVHKKEVKVVKVYEKDHHRHHRHHHHHHHPKPQKVVYYSNYNSGNDIAAAVLGTGLCLAILAAAASN
jgi:hypothetical protein